jgi:hypothetical protein
MSRQLSANNSQLTLNVMNQGGVWPLNHFNAYRTIAEPHSSGEALRGILALTEAAVSGH